jgi:hypothetical protein
MTKHDVAHATESTTVVWPGASWASDRHEAGRLRAELDRVEPVIGAALLTATAFRLRDRAALDEAMRMLVAATRAFEAEEMAHV